MNTHLLNLTPAAFCAATDACRGGREWAVTQPDMATVWDKCHRPRWLLWILRAIDNDPTRELRLFAIWCARNTPLHDGRMTGDLLTDPRSHAALEAAERYAHGLATDKELCVACDAARAAACAAADAAARAAACAAFSADVSSAYAAVLAAQADQLRRMIANPFRVKEANP